MKAKYSEALIEQAVVKLLSLGHRERGLFAHHLTSRSAAFCAAAKTDSCTRELRSLKDVNDQLKRELLRKEKALAEAAALLVLQKKFRACWQDEAK